MGAAKWIGGVVGFMTLGPLGALAGYALGSLLDTDGMFGNTYKQGQDEAAGGYGRGNNSGYGNGSYGSAGGYGTGCNDGRRDSFLFSMLVMASYIIRADGKVMHSEMEFVRNMLRQRFGEMAVMQGQQILLNLFERRKQMDRENPYAFRNTIRECGAQIAANLTYEERLQLLSFLAEIAKSDGNVCAEEIEALKEVATSMGLSAREVESMLHLRGNSLEDAYQILEVDSTATNEEIRAAYRRLALKHHPDRVATLGEDVRKAAEEKFQQINNAKEQIYKARGIK